MLTRALSLSTAVRDAILKPLAARPKPRYGRPQAVPLHTLFSNVNAFVESRDVEAPIRHAGAALVEGDLPAERGVALEHPPDDG